MLLSSLLNRFQVNRLEKVLIEKYRFKVKKTPINGEDGKLPQAQLHKYLADFVFEEDGDRTLLIVYYAGHGVPGGKPGQMRLAGYVEICSSGQGLCL